MPKLYSVIEPATGADGPFYVVSKVDGQTVNVTLSVATVLAALNIARDDQVAAFTGTFVKTELTTVSSGP